MAQVLTLHSPYDADHIEECAREDRLAGLDPTTDVPASWKVIEALTGCEGVVLMSKDGFTFLGEVQDWDDQRSEITVELS